MCSRAKSSASECCDVKVSTTGHLSTKYAETSIVDMDVKLNTIIKFLNTVYALVSDSERHYDPSTLGDVDKAMEAAKNVGFKIQAVKKIMERENPGFGSAIPNIEKPVKS
jgi:hypothetical protein